MNKGRDKEIGSSLCVLPSQHEERSGGKEEAVIREGFRSVQIADDLIAGKVQHPAEMLDVRSDLPPAFFGLEKGQGLAVLDQNEIDLPLGRIADVHDLECPETGFRETRRHLHEAYRQEVLETGSRIRQQRPVEKVELGFLLQRAPDLPVPGSDREHQIDFLQNIDPFDDCAVMNAQILAQGVDA